MSAEKELFEMANDIDFLLAIEEALKPVNPLGRPLSTIGDRKKLIVELEKKGFVITKQDSQSKEADPTVKELVRRTFGDEAAEDSDIVSFYSDVMKNILKEVTEEETISKSQWNVINGDQSDSDALCMIMSAHIDYGGSNGGLISVKQFRNVANSILKWLKEKSK